jgi:nitroreductase
MELYEAINKRHSVREYENKKIPKNILKKLIIAASKAPSAKNEQPWKFYIVSKNKDLNKIKKILKEIVIKNNFKFDNLKPKLRKVAEGFYNNLGNAPCIIFVYKTKKENAPSYQELNDIAGISCAIENLMLSAVEENLGSCWMGTFNKENKISKLVNAKKNEKLIASIILGYPKEGYSPLIREKKKLKNIVKFI